MLSYESFFLIILLSILGPFLGVLGLFFYNVFEKQIYLLQVENRKVSLEKELETRRYLQLHQQIQPHFLFNALNSMFSLIRLKKYDELAKSFEHMILYLRSLYNQNNNSVSPLAEEISYTKNYLEIQKLRFRERLSIKWQIEFAAQVEEIFIVQYLLQTLVENAFKHGLEKVEDELLLTITIKKSKNGKVELIVMDNGPGFNYDPFKDFTGPGVGLNNIRKQLDYLYGGDASLTVVVNQPGETGGVVIVSWPKNIN